MHAFIRENSEEVQIIFTFVVYGNCTEQAEPPERRCICQKTTSLKTKKQQRNLSKNPLTAPNLPQTKTEIRALRPTVRTAITDPARTASARCLRRMRTADPARLPITALMVRVRKTHRRKYLKKRLRLLRKPHSHSYVEQELGRLLFNTAEYKKESETRI